MFEENTVTDITFKGNLEYHISNQFSTKFGFEQKNLHISYQQQFPSGEVDVTSDPEHYIAYFQGNWRPTSRWDIEAGLREAKRVGKDHFVFTYLKKSSKADQIQGLVNKHFAVEKTIVEDKDIVLIANYKKD